MSWKAFQIAFEHFDHAFAQKTVEHFWTTLKEMTVALVKKQL